MDFPPTLRIAFWLALFAGSHWALSSLPVRARLLGTMGEKGFLGFYSLVAFATFVPLVIAYFGNRHAGGLWWNLAAVPGVRHLAMLLAVIGIAVAVAGAIQPSPALAGSTGAARSHGLTRVTRHPLFMGIALWALSHLLLNGFAADAIFFGGLLAFSLAGAAHQDARKRVTDRDRLGPFFSETSFWPFAAILSGRNRLVWPELPWTGLIAGAAVAVGLYALHPWLFR
jgi:uncharacterized membrane protein